MWLNVGWNAFFQSLMPERWRKPLTLAIVRVLISPVRALHQVSKAHRSKAIYDMTITGQTMSLENALNNLFDPEGRGIYIETAVDLTQLYLYNKVEGRPPMRLYNKWKPTTAYTVGQFCAYQADVWKCLAAHTDSAPFLGNTNWEYQGRVVILLNKAEALQLWDFIVWVPVSLTFNWDEMHALLETYAVAGRRFVIRTY